MNQGLLRRYAEGPDVTSAEVFTANIRRETAALAAVIKARGIAAG